MRKIKWLLENRFWDWNDRQQDAPWDESDKIISLICLGILFLVGLVGSLSFIFPDSKVVEIVGISLTVIIGIPILVMIIGGFNELGKGP